jgi:hypothetical protein
MPRRSWFLALVLVSLALLVFGCKKKEAQQPPPSVSKPAPTEAKRPPRVVVPATVQGKWKAVQITITDKDTNTENTYTIDIGSELAVPNTDLSIKVLNFLPAFIMDGTTMTSASNETKNPAAQVVIFEKDSEVFKGWLFSLYPGTHAFQHPKYSFTLVDFIPAKQKKG